MAWKCKHCGKVNRKQSSVAENVKMIDVLYTALDKAGQPMPQEAKVLWDAVKSRLTEECNEKSI